MGLIVARKHRLSASETVSRSAPPGACGKEADVTEFAPWPIKLRQLPTIFTSTQHTQARLAFRNQDNRCTVAAAEAIAWL
jgi:hypothetical protein